MVRSDVCYSVSNAVTATLPAAELAALFAEIGEDLKVIPDGETVFDVLAGLAARRVDGADYAGVTLGRHGGQFCTVAASHDLARRCDQIQYQLGAGPCLDAVVSDAIYNAVDLGTDPRWPQFGGRCVESTGITSMLSLRFYVESDREVIAGLNLYAHRPGAFDENSEALARLLATHGALAVGKANAEEKARNLERALQTSRQIGIALGILMNQHKITSQAAFDLLRVASQHSHRKLADIAAHVAETGALPDRFAAARTEPSRAARPNFAPVRSPVDRVPDGAPDAPVVQGGTRRRAPSETTHQSSAHQSSAADAHPASALR